MRINYSTASTLLLTLSVTVVAQEEARNKIRGPYFRNTTDVFQVAPSRFATSENHDGEHLELNPHLFEGDILPTYELIMGLYGEEVVKELQEKGILSAAKETSGNHTRSLGTAPFNLWDTRVNGVVQVPYAFASGHYTNSEQVNIAEWISEMAQESGILLLGLHSQTMLKSRKDLVVIHMWACKVGLQTFPLVMAASSQALPSTSSCMRLVSTMNRAAQIEMIL